MHNKKLKCLAVEPYYGGSHKYFLDHILNLSIHQWDKLTLPASHWKWRMSLGAYILAQKIDPQKKYDILFVSDYLDLARFIGHSKGLFLNTKKIIYFHENQLTYPHLKSNTLDYNYIINHISSIDVADYIWFNSSWHYEDFTKNLYSFIKHIPDKKNQSINFMKKIEKKVMPIGILDSYDKKLSTKKKQIKTILWNHRWEYDKNPELFYEVLLYLESQNMDFNLFLMGKRDKKKHHILKKIEEKFISKIEINDYYCDKKKYFLALKYADITISTSRHDFFGISILEAMSYGCIPILPNELSYPEIIPKELHKIFLYNNKLELFSKVASLLNNDFMLLKKELIQLRKSITKFNWKNLIHKYDSSFLDSYKH